MMLWFTFFTLSGLLVHNAGWLSVPAAVLDHVTSGAGRHLGSRNFPLKSGHFHRKWRNWKSRDPRWRLEPKVIPHCVPKGQYNRIYYSGFSRRLELVLRRSLVVKLLLRTVSSLLLLWWLWWLLALSRLIRFHWVIRLWFTRDYHTIEQIINVVTVTTTSLNR